MLNKKLYVNYVTLERAIKKFNLEESFSQDKLVTVKNMSALLCSLYVESLTESEAKSDKYAIPMYAYAIIIGDKDDIFFIGDCYTPRRKDSISFLGGQLQFNNLYKSLVKFNNVDVQNYLRYEFLTNACCQFYLSGDDLLNSVNDFTIFKYKIDHYASSDIFRDGVWFETKFNYVKYNHIGQKNPGLYIFAPIREYQLKNHIFDKTVYYSRQQHRVAMNEYLKGRWTKDAFDKLVMAHQTDDVRFNQIELINSIYNSLS